MAGERDGGGPDRAPRAATSTGERRAPARSADERPRPAADRQPPTPTEADRARWRELGRDKFQDAGYQRWAQGHRSVDSLRAAGRVGFAATARRYGRAFAADVLARRRLAHPTAPERRMIGLLDALGQREGADYAREYPVVPGHLYADFAWPERQLAVEIYGDAHTAEWFVERGILERDARRMAAYEEAGWSVRVVTGRDLQERRDATTEQVRALLATKDGEQAPLW